MTHHFLWQPGFQLEIQIGVINVSYVLPNRKKRKRLLIIGKKYIWRAKIFITVLIKLLHNLKFFCFKKMYRVSVLVHLLKLSARKCPQGVLGLPRMQRNLSGAVKMILEIFRDISVLLVSGTNARGEERQGLGSPSAGITQKQSQHWIKLKSWKSQKS